MYLYYSVQFSKTIFFHNFTLLLFAFLCHPQATYLVYHLILTMSTTFFKVFLKFVFQLLSLSATCFILTYHTLNSCLLILIYTYLFIYYSFFHQLSLIFYYRYTRKCFCVFYPYFYTSIYHYNYIDNRFVFTLYIIL